MPCPRKETDELGELTREFNQMALELRNFYRETDRKLIELNQVIRAMLTTLPYPLFILDQQGLITRMNPAAEKLMVHFREWWRVAAEPLKPCKGGINHWPGLSTG